MEPDEESGLPPRLSGYSYSTVRNGRILVSEGVSEGADVAKAGAHRKAVDELQDLIVRNAHPCLGAQGVFNRETYRFGTYPDLADSQATQSLARDLNEFVGELAEAEHTFMSYVAIFDGPENLTDGTFEELLWRQLASLHVLDRPHHAWDASVSSDPDDPSFAFSFAGRAFYVVGMHPESSRLARRFTRPMLVFNARSQFDLLRKRGTYAKMQQLIRERDRALQGSVNPMLLDEGHFSEARQYSGRAVPRDWTCPFHNAVADISSSD